MLGQINLALCCKASLPILYKGIVSLRLDRPNGGRLLTQLSRCLAKQPDGVTHLHLFSCGNVRSTHQLVGVRCAYALQACLQCAGCCMGMPMVCPYVLKRRKGGKRCQCRCALTQVAVQATEGLPRQCCFVPANAAADRHAAANSCHDEVPPARRRRRLSQRWLDCPRSCVSARLLGGG